MTPCLTAFRSTIKHWRSEQTGFGTFGQPFRSNLLPAYLVRIVKTRIFVEGEDDIALVMDECTDAPGCEYVQLPVDGIMCDGLTKQVPLDAGDPEDQESEPEFPWTGASRTESWWYISYRMEAVEWTPFEDDPRRPTRWSRGRARREGVIHSEAAGALM